MSRQPFLASKFNHVAGLTLVEVMVGMLVSAGFLSAALQAYISAVEIQAKAKTANRAITTIQADAESIRQVAQQKPSTNSDCQLDPAVTGGYAELVMRQVKGQDETALSAIPNPSPGWEVSSIVTRSENGKQLLEQSSTLPIADLPSDYQMQRTLSVDLDSSPTTANVLQVSYKVQRVDSSSLLGKNSQAPLTPPSIAQLHTSLIPDAALVCP